LGEIERDPARGAANRRDHAVFPGLGRGAPSRLVGEERKRAAGRAGGRLVLAVCAMRGDGRRVISVRRASRQEEATCPTRSK
jgi:hypothetical protein